MTYFLHTFDGKSIAAKHVVTVDFGLHEEAYRKDFMMHGAAKWYIKRAADDPDLRAILEETMAKDFPKGKPEARDYYHTKVTATDGQTYWVVESRKVAIRAVLDAS